MTKQQGQVRLPEPLTRMAENNARALHRPSPEHRVTALLRALSAALSSRNRWLTGLVVVVAAAPSVFLQIP